MRKLFSKGIVDYFFSWMNILTSVTHLLYIYSYALKFYTIIKVQIEKNKLDDPKFWYMVNNLDKNITNQQSVYETFYWLNAGKYL
jgi:hypothetical protein